MFIVSIGLSILGSQIQIFGRVPSTLLAIAQVSESLLLDGQHLYCSRFHPPIFSEQFLRVLHMCPLAYRAATKVFFLYHSHVQERSSSSGIHIQMLGKVQCDDLRDLISCAQDLIETQLQSEMFRQSLSNYLV